MSPFLCRRIPKKQRTIQRSHTSLSNISFPRQNWNSPYLFSIYSALYKRNRPCSPLGYSTIKTLTTLRAPVRRFDPSSTRDWLLPVSWPPPLTLTGSVGTELPAMTAFCNIDHSQLGFSCPNINGTDQEWSKYSFRLKFNVEVNFNALKILFLVPVIQVTQILYWLWVQLTAVSIMPPTETVQ